jgi:hypothetical protein
MAQIKIESSDCQIWHIGKVSAEITASLINDGTADIHLNYEGPCARSLGLYDLLDQIVNLTGVPKSQITIYTWNQNESHNEYVVTRSPSDKGIEKLKKTSVAHLKQIGATTKHFGSFVGHGNRIRLALSAHLHKHHADKTLQSYHTDVTNEYFREFIGLEDLMFYRYEQETIQSALELLVHAPMKIDTINHYPILFHTDKVYDILEFYDMIFVDIVNQTYFTGNTFFLDDKFWRSIVTKTPFIVQGPQYFLHNLKKLGFQTFDRWWDEGYSEDPPDYQAKLIIDNIDMIASWDTKKLSKIYDEMKPTLDHNYDVFMSLNGSDFRKAFEYV